MTTTKTTTMCYSVSEELTWLIYNYVEENNHYCCVDILALTMRRDKFRSRVSTNGRKIMVEIVKPKLFFEYDRLENINLNNSNFNVNTHKTTAYKAVLREMRRDKAFVKRRKLLVQSLLFLYHSSVKFISLYGEFRVAIIKISRSVKLQKRNSYTIYLV